MRNSIISVLLFCALCLTLFYINGDVVEMLNYVSYTATQLEELINENQLDEAKRISEILYNELEIKESLPSIYLNHTEYDTLSDEATRVFIYLKENEIADTLTSIRLLKNNAENLLELQKINLENIF